MSQFPPPLSGAGQAPHRGVLVLVLGILSLVVCAFLGPVAWILGNKDLAEMAAGRMDRSGEGMTKAGKICGIIGCVFLVLGVLWVIFVLVLGVGMAAAGAAGAGGGATP